MLDAFEFDFLPLFDDLLQSLFHFEFLFGLVSDVFHIVFELEQLHFPNFFDFEFLIDVEVLFD